MKLRKAIPRQKDFLIIQLSEPPFKDFIIIYIPFSVKAFLSVNVKFSCKNLHQKLELVEALDVPYRDTIVSK